MLCIWRKMTQQRYTNMCSSTRGSRFFCRRKARVPRRIANAPSVPVSCRAGLIRNMCHTVSNVYTERPVKRGYFCTRYAAVPREVLGAGR